MLFFMERDPAELGRFPLGGPLESDRSFAQDRAALLSPSPATVGTGIAKATLSGVLKGSLLESGWF